LAEPDDLGRVIADLLTDTTRRAALTAAGSARARAFDLGRVVDAYERIYRQRLARARRTRGCGRRRR
jgi:hypothetical protein